MSGEFLNAERKLLEDRGWTFDEKLIFGIPQMTYFRENGDDSLDFERAAKAAFAFLNTLGFSEIQSLPTLIRYRNGEIEVDVYHGRKSYELGVGITRHGVRYSLSEFIRAADPELARRYRNPTATEREGIRPALDQVAQILQRYGARALRGDPAFFTELVREGKHWSHEYALEVLARQLRPLAHEAFRLGKYSEAARLYSQFQTLLSPAEQKKLATAIKRSSGDDK
jgi:hypothetical protein